ncbi:uncharacterized protein [Musca autumnalis]|uniref:uncharacterized protein n=1 Tax=Musca autumnalis TaxID=221902 RepID=UPI003CF7BE9B
MVRLNSKFRKISIVQCYAPTEPDDEESKDLFYSQLDAVINSLPKGDIKLIIGDFNAKVGCNNSNLSTVMGTQGLGDIRNENGDRLVDFCARHRLFIGGTKFAHKNIHKYTWESPDGHTRNQIDHILISKLFLGSLMDVKTRRGADIDSDHMLLVATLRLRLAVVKRQHQKRNKLNLLQLQNPEVAHRYKLMLTERLQGSNSNTWENIAETCREAATTVIGTAKQTLKPWITSETLEALKHRKRLRNIFLNSKTNEAKTQAKANYRTAANTVKRLARRDKRLYYNKLAEQAEQASNIGNIRGVYETIKIMSGNNIRPISTIKDENGQELSSPDEQVDRWRRFFSTENPSDNETQPNTSTSTLRRNPRRDVNTDPPTYEEVLRALKSLKSGKAAGPDNIPSELLKYGAEPIAQTITPIIRDVWKTNVFPNEWKNGTIVTIPKKVI